MQRIIVTILLSVVILAPVARGDDAAALRAENARLRERVEQLERENARLRHLGADPDRLDDEAIAERVTVTPSAGGDVLATAQIPLTVTEGSRADHALDLVGDGPVVRGTIRSWFSGGVYASVTEVVFDADDRTFRLPVTAYDATPIRVGSPQRRRRRDHERVTFEIPPDALRALAAARSVGGRIGRVRFLVERDGQATIRAFESRHDDGGR